MILWRAMKCPECNKSNPSEAKFCAECGSKLTLRCSRCNTPVVYGAKFCIECGSPVGSVPTAGLSEAL